MTDNEIREEITRDKRDPFQERFEELQARVAQKKDIDLNEGLETAKATVEFLRDMEMQAWQYTTRFKILLGALFLSMKKRINEDNKELREKVKWTEWVADNIQFMQIRSV